MIAWAGLLSCGRLAGFDCTDDEQCRSDGRVGVCLGEGACAYEDPSCPSGVRYSDHARASVAGTCAVLPSSTTGTSSTGTDPVSSAPTSTSTTGDEQSTGAATTAVGPECGDGVLEEPEQCDDGNDAPDDGCELDCRISQGTLLAEFTSDLPGNDGAHDVLLVDEDIIVAGRALGGDGSTDIYVQRFTADGTVVWPKPYTRGGAAQGDDRARTLTLTVAQTLLVAGHIRPNDGTPQRDQIWVAELDLDGTLLWEAQIGQASPVHEQAYDVLALPGDAFVLAGRRNPTGSKPNFIVGHYTRAAEMVTQDWLSTINGPADEADWGFALALDLDGVLLAGGATHSTVADVDRRLESLHLSDGKAASCLDDGGASDGVVPDGNDQIRGLAVAADGRIAAAGFAVKSEAEGQDAWVGWYSRTLDPEPPCMLDKQDFVAGEGHASDAALAVAFDADGNTIVVGQLRGAELDENIWVAKYDAQGDLLWQSTHDGDGSLDDRAHAVAIDARGSIVVAGQVSRPGDVDLWVGRFAP